MKPTGGAPSTELASSATFRTCSILSCVLSFPVPPPARGRRSPLRRSRMPPAPRTIKDYKTALLRLNVPLPSGKTSLAEYQALWLQHQPGDVPDPRLTPTKRPGSAGAGSSRGAPRPRHGGDDDVVMAPAPQQPAPRPTSNVPLAQQHEAMHSGAVSRHTPWLPSLAQQHEAMSSGVGRVAAPPAAAAAAMGQPAAAAARLPAGRAVGTPAAELANALTASGASRRTSWLPSWGQAWPSSALSGPPDAAPIDQAAAADPVPTYTFGAPLAVPVDASSSAGASSSAVFAETPAPPSRRMFGWPDVLASAAIVFVAVLLAALALAPPAPLGLPSPEYLRLPAGSPAAPRGMGPRHMAEAAPDFIAQRFAAVLHTCTEGWQSAVNATIAASTSAAAAAATASAGVRRAVDDLSVRGMAAAFVDLGFQLLTNMLLLAVAVLYQAAYFLSVGLFFLGAKLVAVAYELSGWLFEQAVDDPVRLAHTMPSHQPLIPRCVSAQLPAVTSLANPNPTALFITNDDDSPRRFFEPCSPSASAAESLDPGPLLARCVLSACPSP